MSSDTVDDREIPEELATAIERAFGLEEPPATLGEWADATGGLLDTADFEFGLEVMCTADEGRHVAWIDPEPQAFNCVLDTLLVPLVVSDDDQERFEVESASPVSGTIVELTVTRDGSDSALGRVRWPLLASPCRASGATIYSPSARALIGLCCLPQWIRPGQISPAIRTKFGRQL